MQSHDWSRFLLRIPIEADRQRIYDCWTTQCGLESWFLRQAAFTREDGTLRSSKERVAVNDQYEWLWHGWPDDTVEKGKIIAMNGVDFLRFSFGKAGNVSITIRTEGPHTVVELLQDNIPTDENAQAHYHLGCSKGWTFYLANLKSILENGPDLRNRDVQLKNVISS